MTGRQVFGMRLLQILRAHLVRRNLDFVGRLMVENARDQLLYSLLVRD